MNPLLSSSSGLTTNPVTSVSGGWYSTTLDVQISYDDIQSAIEPVVYDGSGNAIIDSGGLGGYIPHELLPSSLSSYTNGYDLPAGTTISFYNSDGTTLLYTETVTPALYSAGNGQPFRHYRTEPVPGLIPSCRADLLLV